MGSNKSIEKMQKKNKSTPSSGPRITAFKICMTPLLAPSVRYMSSGSLQGFNQEKIDE